MTFFEGIYVLGIFFVITLLGERWVRKKYNIPKRDGWLHKPLHRWQPWIEGALFLVVFGMGISLDFAYGITIYYALIFFILLFSYRTYTEWKYKREEKQYISNIFTVAMLVALYIVLYLIL